MNNTKKNKQKIAYRIVIAVCSLIMLLATVLGLLHACGRDKSSDVISDDDPPTQGIIYDTGAIEGGWDEADTDKIVDSLNQKVEEGMINISMNTTPNFANGTAAGNLMIVNESVNRYPQVVEITLSDTGELIYKSGAIPVGKKIENAKLLVDLDPGKYECTAMFYNVDPATGNYLGCAGAVIQISVAG